MFVMNVNVDEVFKQYNETDLRTIKINLRRVRKDKGLTPQFFEKNTDMSKHTYVNYEKLSYFQKPAFEGLWTICSAMEVNINELFKEIKED